MQAEERNDDEDMPEGEYEVEKILKCRKIAKGKYEFLVQWKGYPDEDTWEPLDNLNGDLKDEAIALTKKK